MPRKPFSPPVETLDHELLGEKAATLGRLGRGLEAALAELRAFDAAHPGRGGGAAAAGKTAFRDAAFRDAALGDAETARKRRELVATAGHALWIFAVQREACGVYEIRGLMRDYGVPPEVQDRMGMIPVRRNRGL